jgi:DNA-binding response OmpR family regulator
VSVANPVYAEDQPEAGAENLGADENDLTPGGERAATAPKNVGGGMTQPSARLPGPILVVDDEPYVVRALSYLLLREGYQVLTASDGEEALAIARQQRPSLIFLDLKLPRTNGYEVCEQIRRDATLAGTYVIMLSAHGQTADRLHGLQAGADEYMTKPFSPRMVAEHVQVALAAQESGRVVARAS